MTIFLIIKVKGGENVKNYKKILIPTILLILFFIALSATSAAETNIASGDDLGGAVQNAANGDTINLDAGTYTKNVTNISIDKNLTIKGKNPKTTIIDAQNLGRIFIIEYNGTLTLINITLINANSTGVGGAIYNGNTLLITNCEFINNTARSGGAIFSGTFLSITDSNFTTNTAIQNGGAISTNDVVNITGSNFNSNTAIQNGGAIYQYNGKMNITNSSFTNNSAIRNGGAVILLNATDMTINNTIFKNNIAELGSSIYKDSVNFLGIPTNLTVINSNFTDNKGGATIYLKSINTIITGSNIFNNTQGILISDNSSAIINYNRIFNNTNITGYNLDDWGIGSDLDFNWWGDNNPKVNGTLKNYFIMNVTNATSLNNSNGTVTFDYTFRLNNGEDANNSLLPYFITEVYTNLTSGVITSFDARYNYIFDVTVNTSGNIEYKFITDNEIQILEGTATIPDPEDPVEPVEPVDPVDPEDSINETSNNLTTQVAALMKETGLPINLILIVLLSLIGFGYYRKQ
jgi:predicted outer membrane repeat protein